MKGKIKKNKLDEINNSDKKFITSPAKNNGKHPGGRPTIYSDELVQTILDRLTSGESLESICRDDRMPTVVTVFNWRKSNKQFFKAYARARKLQAEILLDKSREAAEKGAEYAYSIPATVQEAAKANAIANMIKLQVGGYQYLAERYNNKFAPHQNIKSKNENNNNNKNNDLPISERINRITELAKNHVETESDKNSDC